jgi:hypothetical protein
MEETTRLNRFDITQTNAAVERLIETTENPRHLYLLHAYNRHRYLEMAGRFEEIFTPEMTVERPVYRFNILDTTTTLNGAEAVKEVYREWTRTAQCIFYTGGDEIVSRKPSAPTHHACPSDRDKARKGHAATVLGR